VTDLLLAVSAQLSLVATLKTYVVDGARPIAVAFIAESEHLLAASAA
jgi:hypothetical protein